jgi:hypothetical protein
VFFGWASKTAASTCATGRPSAPLSAWRVHTGGWVCAPRPRTGSGSVPLSLCTTAQPLYTVFTKIFGASIPKATMRPKPSPDQGVEHMVGPPDSPSSHPTDAESGVSARIKPGQLRYDLLLYSLLREFLFFVLYCFFKNI